MEEINLKCKNEKIFNVFTRYQYLYLFNLEYGIAKSNYPEKNKELLYGFVSPFKIIPFTGEDAENFGRIRAYLNKLGTPIGPYDLQIAAQCLTRDLCLITNNVKEFKRFPMLKFENWTTE